MKCPHWIRHRWTVWKPVKVSYPGSLAWDTEYDERACVTCGRRQRRYL